MDAKILAAALNWLLSHYEVGSPDCKGRVVAAIDDVLKGCDVTGEDLRRFRELHLYKKQN